MVVGRADVEVGELCGEAARFGQIQAGADH
jgi:hypothetical protein